MLCTISHASKPIYQNASVSYSYVFYISNNRFNGIYFLKCYIVILSFVIYTLWAIMLSSVNRLKLVSACSGYRRGHDHSGEVTGSWQRPVPDCSAVHRL